MNNKKTILDLIVAVVAIIGLVICAFFWGCKLDLPVTILAIVVIAAGTVLLTLQNKKIADNNAE